MTRTPRLRGAELCGAPFARGMNMHIANTAKLNYRGMSATLRLSLPPTRRSLIMPHIPSKTDLPPFEEAFHGRHERPGLESVYKNYILAAYVAATTEIQRMKIRVLGYLLIWSLNHTSLSEVVRSVKRCFDGQSSKSPYERLDELGDFYTRHLIRPCACVPYVCTGFHTRH